MTPDEVVKELEALYKTGNNFLEADEPKALLSAISLIQDYQKLRESKDKEIVALKKRIEELGDKIQGLYDDQAGADL